jgi:hypothetical protein
MLGLLKEKEIFKLEEGMIGSISAVPGETWHAPKSVMELVEWMTLQRARGPKAIPTLLYFESLTRVLREIARVLRPEGVCAMVVSSQHQFYELVSREVVRKFDMVSAITQIATEPAYEVGMERIGAIEIELPKMDFVQRPAGRHAYSETTILFKKTRR